MPFDFQRLSIPEVVLIQPKVFGDARGFFLEAFKLSDFRARGLELRVVQSNHSRSTRNVLRGLHYQLNPHAQGKLVRCLEGAILDVAVDVRQGSPSYGKWVGAELTSENQRLIYVPPGFAHGFCVTSEIAQIIYYCTEEYSPEHERGIIWNDPAIGIAWPVENPVLSDKDRIAPLLKDVENTFVYGES
jgi:dTDP-4-dehydrorhamnose 3,5-epimerase